MSLAKNINKKKKKDSCTTHHMKIKANPPILLEILKGNNDQMLHQILYKFWSKLPPTAGEHLQLKISLVSQSVSLTKCKNIF